MPTSLPPELVRSAFGPLDEHLAAFARDYPGDRRARQPVHTVYGGAHLFRADTAQKLGRRAEAAFAEAFPDDATLASVLELRADPALVRARVRAKLAAEPVEDLRIDFEDGYGPRPPAEEDAHAEAAARELARGLREQSLPAGIGIRIKAFTPEQRDRALRTLDLVLTTLVAEAGAVPPAFVVTLPKVQLAGQVATLAELLEDLEERLGLARGAVGLELMIETPQSLVAPDGGLAPFALVREARGRCTAVHVGSYDLTASFGVAAAHQALAHPACDLAKHLLQASLAGTGVFLADGATNVLPLPRHRAPEGGALTAAQVAENREAVHAAARLHARNVRHGIRGGWWQGWDLHPAQIPVRLAALHDFFLNDLPKSAERLGNFLAEAARATRVGSVFDDAATGQGLLNFFARGYGCGALDAAALASAGLRPEDLAERSFARLVAARAG